MEVIDFGAMIVVYNFVIGVMLMLASEKLGSFAGYLNTSQRGKIARLTRVSVFAFGAGAAVLSAGIYIAFHALKIGV